MTYLAILESKKDGSFYVTFPDLPGCSSYGDDINDARRNAAEAASLYIYAMECDDAEIPFPSSYLTQEEIHGNSVIMITIHPNLVRIKKDSERVRTNITLPAWLKKIAEDQKINYSRFLEAALLEQLQIPGNRNKI